MTEADARTQDELRRALSDDAPPGSVRVSVAGQDLARRAGIRGVVFGLSRADGVTTPARAKLELDYSAFKFAYGGDYGGRLTLVSLPDCVLATPDRPECRTTRQVPGARNLHGRSTVSADALTVAGDSVATASSGQTSGIQANAPAMFALMAGTGSPGGNWRATDLSQAYSWSSGGAGGDFTTTYGFEIPPGLGGPMPEVSLNYSSGSVDARTHSENGQASWIGEGWSLSAEAYIERSYRPCSDDGDMTGDLCWSSPNNATMVFEGRSVRLIRDETTGVWKASSDSGIRVEKLNLTDWGNGDDDDEYWKVTTLDGTQYFFGSNKRYADDPMETKSTLVVPVFGTDPGEPCYLPGDYANSWCYQAYRWNLDYVKDPQGNSMTYFYSEYIGNYGRNNNSAVSAYDITAPLNRIEYGTRAGSEGSAPAPMRVLFFKDERCLDPCEGPENFPDTPLDKVCTSGSCPDTTSPVFFTPYRLAEVTTQVRNGAAGEYRDVNSWLLWHTFPPSGDDIPPAGDDTNPNLWLKTITREGHLPDGNTHLEEPPTTFGGDPMENRVTWDDDIGPPYNHYRLTTINNGIGGETRITYSDKECPSGGFVPKFDANPNRCYSIKFAPEGSTADPQWDLFHKYVVTEVKEVDLTGGGPDEVWSYAYSTAATNEPTLWRHDYNETSTLADRTWSEWLGYPQVTVTHGPSTGPQTVTTTLYHRGLDGDARFTPDEMGRVWGARTASILTPLGVVGRTSTLAGTGSRCFEPNGTGNGSVVRAVTCTGSANQKWHRFEDNTLRHDATDKCLDPAGPTNGSAVQLWDCVAGPPADQQWRLQPNGTLKNMHSDRCVQIPGFNTASGVNLTVQDCTGGWNQVWTPTGAFGMANNQSQRCADLWIDGTANGTHVVTWVCNNDANQLWQQQPNNTWKNPVSNRCLDIVDSGTAAGTLVQLWDCTGAANQIWIPQADGTLKNPNSNRCLDTGANPATQQRLRIENCNATAVTQQWVAGIPDSDGLNGFTAEERTLDGTVEVVTTYHEPTVVQTATRDSPEAGGQDLTALMTTETATRARTRIAATNSWRWTETTKTYDSYGLPTQTRLVGDTAVATDDTCITFAYARNTTKFLIDYPSQSVTRAGSTCGPGDPRILENRIFYDGTTTLGAAPTAGLATRNQTLASQSPSEVWANTDTGYDIYGRSTSVTDARGKTTTTAYTPTTGGPVLQTTVTNPLGHTVVTTLDGHRGLPLSITDANGRTTSGEYDPLGRLTRVRQPGSSPPNPPDIEYAYTLSASGANSVTTKHLGPNGNQIATYELYDGRLRPRQTQQPGPQANGGRIITDTAYDGRGLAIKTSTFWNNAAPSTTLASFTDAAVPSQTRATYDNRKRTTAGQLWSLGTMKWETTTAYDGDRTMVTPPGGGIPTTTLVNAGGNTVELRQHTSGGTNGPYQATSYIYDPIGRLTQVTDPAGNRWTTTYDTGSRITSTTDPDKGEIENVHNAAGDLLSSTDARGVTLSYAYDDLGRRTQLWQGDVGTGTKRAEWFFDTLADGTNVKGHPVKSVRWHDNEAYSSEVTSVDPMYRPLTTKVNLPASMTTLAGPWVTTSTYKPNGSLATRTLPAAGSLPEETITYSYDNAGYPLTMVGLDTYISSTAYYNWGGVHQKTLGVGTKRVQIQTTVDEATRRLTENRVSTENQTTPGTWTPQLVEQYGYDSAGNVKNIRQVDAGGTTVSNQCFNHDGLRRLTEAWTTTTTCQPAPAQAVVGGPDPYWSSYRYDAIGNRTQDTVHTPGGDTTRDYTYPASGPNSVRPHAISGITATGLTTGTDTYSYDDAGNTATRNIAGRPGQTLTWDPEDHLASLTDSGGTTSYIYTANGQRLVADEPGSTTTVYLGGFELRRTITGVTATRHYGVAARTTSAGLTWLATDHHNTGQLSIHPTTLATTRRKSDPFGKTRGAAAAWPTTRGFVNGIQDPTGLVHLGAREYEPDTGRFISVDPVMDLSDPTQWNGYSYSNSNPTTFSDPSGLSFDSTPGMGDGLINNGPPAPYVAPTTNNNAGNPTSTKKSSCNWVCKAKKAGKAALEVVNGVSEDIIYGTVDAVQGRWNEFTQTYHENGWQAAANWVVWNVAFTPTAGFRTFHELSNSIWNGYKGAAASAGQGHYVDSARQAIGATIALATLVAPVVAGKGPGAGAGPKTPKAGGAPKTGEPKGGGPASGPAKSSPPVKAPWEGNSPHRLPEEWGEGQPNRKGGPGWRWFDPEIPRRAGVRIDKAKPGVDSESQWVDHVVVRDGGRVIGRDGKPLRSAKEADAHIPLIEWEQWSAWNKKE